MQAMRWRALGFAAMAALWLAVAMPPARAMDQLTTQDKVALQTTMAQYIEQRMIGDAFLHMDPVTGKLQKLYPVTQHPMIVTVGNVIVLCADLRNDAGKTVNADFYVTRDAGNFVIFQTEIENREPLKALIMKGAASMLE